MTNYALDNIYIIALIFLLLVERLLLARGDECVGFQFSFSINLRTYELWAVNSPVFEYQGLWPEST